MDGGAEGGGETGVTWRTKSVTISAARLLSYLLLAGGVFGTLAIALAIIGTALFGETPPWLFFAFLILLAVRLIVSLAERISYHVRRSARRRRMRLRS